MKKIILKYVNKNTKGLSIDDIKKENCLNEQSNLFYKFTIIVRPITYKNGDNKYQVSIQTRQ
jgi:hypothetical protein